MTIIYTLRTSLSLKINKLYVKKHAVFIKFVILRSKFGWTKPWEEKQSGWKKSTYLLWKGRRRWRLQGGRSAFDYVSGPFYEGLVWVFPGYFSVFPHSITCSWGSDSYQDAEKQRLIIDSTFALRFLSTLSAGFSIFPRTQIYYAAGQSCFKVHA